MSEAVIGVAATAVVGLVSAFLTWSVSRRGARTSEVKTGVDTLSAASQEWQELYEAMKQQQVLLAERVSALETRSREAELRENQLLTDLSAVFRWIEEGQVPPPPTRPDYLRRFLSNGG